MSMILRGPVAELKRCPDCDSPKLVVVLYGLKKDPLGGKPTLECEGCYSVVKELSTSEVESLRKTKSGRAIISRESEL